MFGNLGREHLLLLAEAGLVIIGLERLPGAIGGQPIRFARPANTSAAPPARYAKTSDPSSTAYSSRSTSCKSRARCRRALR
jgi:hypothetical protein